MRVAIARPKVHRETPFVVHGPVTRRSLPRLMIVIRHAGPPVCLEVVFVHETVQETPARSMRPAIGFSASNLTWFARFAGEFYAIRHARSVGCVGGAASTMNGT